MKFYDLSAAGFADKIEVGRSSISHLLSGRNKPSLEFVMKVVKTFPEVELYWLLNGKGTFPKNLKETASEETDTAKNQENISQTTPRLPGTRKNIAKIIIFYNDGSFEAFEN